MDKNIKQPLIDTQKDVKSLYFMSQQEFQSSVFDEEQEPEMPSRPTPTFKRETQLHDIDEKSENEETTPKKDILESLDITFEKQSQILNTCEEVIESIKSSQNSSKFTLKFGTQSKSIFTRQGNLIVTRFNDSDDRENDMKVLYNIDMESKKVVKYTF